MSDQGSTYTEFITAELNREYERRTKIDTRAATSVTSATGLITISLAVLAVIEGKDFTIHGLTTACIVFALLAFITSAVLATLAAFNWSYDVAAPNTLRGMLMTDHWQDSQVTARNFTSQLNRQTLISLRHANNKKTDLFLACLIAQVAAIVGIAITVITIVI